MTQMIGRLHPLLVHLPIGILLLAAVFEILACFKPYRKLGNSVPVMLLFGAVSSTLSVVTGLSLADSGAYDDRIVEIHKITGIITAIFSWIILFTRASIISLFKQKRKRRVVRTFMFIPLIALISITGHMGGTLTHGENYLTGEPSQDEPRALKLTLPENPDSAKLYADIIVPILDSRCYSCHGQVKQKGQLRLDQPKFITSGGKHGEVIDVLQPDSSELYKRLMLPLEDDHHMPPNEKPQLASAELALIRAWLAEGASYDKTLAELHDGGSVKRFVQVLTTPSQQQRILPEQEAVPANEASVAALVAQGVVVIPLSDSTHYLSASYLNARSITDDQLALLLPLKDQLLSLDLSRTSISNGAMQHIVKLHLLTHLNLQYTLIADAGLKGIASLNHLQTINLVGTNITDAGLDELSQIKSLQRVYCYGTGVTKEGVVKLMQQRKNMAIDTGHYVLEARITDTLEFKAPKKK
jgi:uncharacterized membrane protein